MEFWLVASGAFLGAIITKIIELRNSYGDYYYFLRTSGKYYIFLAVYGLAGVIIFVLLNYSDIINEDLIPKNPFEDAETDTLGSTLLVMVAFGLVIGFSSKSILDLPLTGSADNLVTLRSIILLITPINEDDFKNTIANNQLKYLQKIIQQNEGEILEMKDINKRVYDFLDLHQDYQDESGQRKIDILLNDLTEISKNGGTPEDGLRFVFKSLGRKLFRDIFR